MKAILTSILLTIIPSGLVQAQHDRPVKLNAPLVSGGEVLEFAASPDGQWVVYRADQDADNVIELYSVPSTGGTVTKLNDPLVPGGAVGEFAISPDSAWVVYRADQVIDGHFDLFSVPIAGGFPRKLNQENQADRKFAITPDSSRVVFIHTYDHYDRSCPCTVPITGGMVEEFCTGGIGAHFTGHFEISRDSEYLVFTKTRHGDAGAVLFGFRTDGSGGGVLDACVQGDHFRISPDSRRVVSRQNTLCGGVFGLNSVAITGGDDLHLTDSGGVKIQISPFPVGGDYQVVSRSGGLYSIPINGGMQVALSPFFFPLDVVPFEITPDGTRVVYAGSEQAHGPADLYSVETLGGYPIKLNGPLIVDGTVWSFQLSADSRYAIYYADEEVDDFYELYSVPVAGGEIINLSGAVRADYQTAADGVSVVYRTYADELFEVPILGGDAVMLSENVQSYGLTGDGQRVVYLGDQPPHDVIELYSVPRAVFGEPSIDQLCPCQGQWKNHGRYVSCVSQAAKDHPNRSEIVSEAARSNCGK